MITLTYSFKEPFNIKSTAIKVSPIKSNRTNILTQLFIMFILVFVSYYSHAIDIVKLHVQQLSENKVGHNIEVIRRALEITEPEFGQFKLELIRITMTGNRMMQSSLEGELINTVIQPANDRWDKQHIAVRVPIRLELLSYRLLLVNKADLPQFEKITTLQELAKLSAGLSSYWETTKIFKSHGLKIVETSHFTGIFSMLSKHRFEYLPRGIHEIYDELALQQPLLKDVVVEPNLALNVPMQTYVYVSPESPQIAKRLDVGLRSLLANGELKRILYKHYAKDIDRANLKGRRVINIENPYYKKEIQLNAEDLFFNP